MKKDVTQTFLSMGELGGELRDKDYPALEIMADILGGGFQSRLVQQIRTKMGNAYEISASWARQLRPSRPVRNLRRHQVPLHRGNHPRDSAGSGAHPHLGSHRRGVELRQGDRPQQPGLRLRHQEQNAGPRADVRILRIPQGLHPAVPESAGSRDPRRCAARRQGASGSGALHHCGGGQSRIVRAAAGIPGRAGYPYRPHHCRT